MRSCCSRECLGFSTYLHSRSRKWEWNLPFTFTFPFPKMGMEIAISRSRSRSPKVIPAHGCMAMIAGIADVEENFVSPAPPSKICVCVAARSVCHARCAMVDMVGMHATGNVIGLFSLLVCVFARYSPNLY